MWKFEYSAWHCGNIDKLMEVWIYSAMELQKSSKILSKSPVLGLPPTRHHYFTSAIKCHQEVTKSS